MNDNNNGPFDLDPETGFEPAKPLRSERSGLLYCDNCIWLSPNELEQNDYGHKEAHRCLRNGKRVMHSGCHPHILRLLDCGGDETI